MKVTEQPSVLSTAARRTKAKGGGSKRCKTPSSARSNRTAQPKIKKTQGAGNSSTWKVAERPSGMVTAARRTEAKGRGSKRRTIASGAGIRCGSCSHSTQWLSLPLCRRACK